MDYLGPNGAVARFTMTMRTKHPSLYGLVLGASSTVAGLGLGLLILAFFDGI